MNCVIREIQSRRSNPNCTTEKVPDELIRHLILCGMSANDHGRIAPWQFHIYKGEGRSRLAAAFVQHEQMDGNLDLLDKARAAPYRAPLVICVLATPTECRIPISDQLYSASAACQLVTLAASSLGLAAYWRTGKYSESKIVKSELDFQCGDEIVGFIYVGFATKTINSTKPVREDRIFVYE